MRILVTGVAGFIGFNLSKRLLDEGHYIVGIDNLNDYYDVNLKIDRLGQIKAHHNFDFYKIDLKEKREIEELFQKHKPEVVINLAAQAGVRYSIENPDVYVQSNIIGFLNILEACRYNSVKNFIYASSSSVYGANTKNPFSTSDNVDHPISLYAATKKSNELMAHTYSSLYGLPTIGLRFFTVYGPWGRPDMALFKFTKNIIEDKPIDVYNQGQMIRDFTYIDDIVESIVRLIKVTPKPNPNWSGTSPDPSSSFAPYKIYNIGNNNPEKLLDFIKAIEEKLEKSAKKNMMPMQPGDVPATYADVDDLFNTIQFRPRTSIKKGIGHFIDWYTEYYKLKK